MKALEPDRLNCEEVDRQDLIRVLADELAPGALAAAWSMQETVASEHVAHRAVGASAAELQEFALDFSSGLLVVGRESVEPRQTERGHNGVTDSPIRPEPMRYPVDPGGR